MVNTDFNIVEGIAQSTLQIAKHPNKKNDKSKKTVSEIHKVKHCHCSSITFQCELTAKLQLLYLTETLFPPSDVRQLGSGTTGKDGFTLAPGRYQYPFEFRIPVNNDCTDTKNFISKLTESTDAKKHISATLPPSCDDTEFATIKYLFLFFVIFYGIYRDRD